MSITVSSAGAQVDLSNDLYWSDEHAWHEVEQTVQRTLTGALIVSSAARQAGRPITLKPEDESSAWVTLDQVSQLRSWAAVPGKQMQLIIRGVPRTVIFRHHDGAAVEAAPVVHFSDTDSTDYYRVTLRFMEV